MIMGAATTIARIVPCTVENSIYDMPERHSGAKKERYLEACRQYELRGLMKSDSFCKMFVKAERFDVASKRNPDPRAIQYRGGVYCVAFAAFLRPIEDFIYLSSFANDGVPPTRNVAKGLNSVMRAELLVTKLTHFADPVVVSVDMSRFDKHVAIAHLKANHYIYLASNPSKLFASILSLQLNNKCFSNLGLKYKCEGRRMSGDMDTAIGNILIMLTMVIAICRLTLKFSRWDCLDDGDDCLIILERDDLPTFQAEASGLFLQMGMEMTVSSTTSSLFQIDFCKSRVIEYQPSRYKFVRDFRDVCSKSLCGSRNWTDPIYRERVINATGMCELVLNLGVPVLQSFACALLRNTRGGTRRHARDGLLQRALRDASRLGVAIENVQPVEICQCARESFAEAFGLDPIQQQDIESSLDAWVFTNDEPFESDSDWDVLTWFGCRTHHELYPIGHV